MTPTYAVEQTKKWNESLVYDSEGRLSHKVSSNWNRLNMTFVSERTGLPEFVSRPHRWYTITQEIASLPDEFVLAFARSKSVNSGGTLTYRLWDDSQEIGTLTVPPADPKVAARMKKERWPGLGFWQIAAKLKEPGVAQELTEQIEAALPPGVFQLDGREILRFRRLPSRKRVEVEQVRPIDRRIALALAVYVLYGDPAINPSSS